MYIKTSRRARRQLSGLGWTGGFTLPGSTTRYSTETCTGSAAVPMSGGNTICGMPSESAYLNGLGCVAVGFRGEHDCLTDAGNAGAVYCCPAGVLAAAQAGGASVIPTTPDTPIRGGAITTQIVGIAGVAAIFGVLWYMLMRKRQDPELGLPELTPEQELWADESGSAFAQDLRKYRQKYGLED